MRYISSQISPQANVAGCGVRILTNSNICALHHKTSTTANKNNLRAAYLNILSLNAQRLFFNLYFSSKYSNIFANEPYTSLVDPQKLEDSFWYLLNTRPSKPCRFKEIKDGHPVDQRKLDRYSSYNCSQPSLPSTPE